MNAPIRLTLVLAALLPCAVGAQQVRALPDYADIHREAFIRERAYPFDSIPAGAMQRALRSVEGMRGTPMSGGLSPSLGAAPAVASSGVWRSIGPNAIAPGATYYNGRGPTSGRVNAIAVNPRNTNVVYIGTARGGVWKTSNGGVTWTPITDTQCALAINTVVLDPVNPSIVYAGVGDHGNGFTVNCGVLRSTDDGATWTQLGGAVFSGSSSSGFSVLALHVDPASAGSTTSTVLIAATTGGLFRSTNSGQTWSQTSPHFFESIVATSADGSRLFAGTSRFNNPGGVFYSTDRGLTWLQAADGLPLSGVGRTMVAVAPSSRNIVYAASCNGTNPLYGVYRSTDGGVTWSARNITLGGDFNSQCWYGLHLTVDPDDPDRVYLGGGVWLYRSTDGGVNFSHIGDQQVHTDQQSFAVDPKVASIVYAGSDGGIFRSMDKGTTWTSLNSTIATALFTRGIAINPFNPAQVLGGTQDNGSIESNGTAVWNEVSSGDGGYGAYDVNTGNTAFTEYVWVNNDFSGPQRRDGSGGFSYRRTGIILSDRGQFYPPLVMDPVRGRILYFGTYRIYRTENAGDQWTPISADLSRGSGTITAIAGSASDSLVVFAGTSDGNIQVTRDLGLTWKNGTGLPNRAVTGIVVDSLSSQTAWATTSGFGANHVWKTVDGGLTWTSVSSTLPDAPANAIVHQQATHELDVATDVGLFRSTDGGTTWSLFPGLPNVVVMSLAWHAASKTIVAGTYGRGMFAYSFTPTSALRGDVDVDGQVTAADAQSVLNAVIGRIPVTTHRLWPNGDANCDGMTSVLDAQVILSFVVGLPLGAGCVNVSR